MYHVANVVFFISILGCIGCGIYGFFHTPDPWATTKPRGEKFVTITLIVSIVMLFVSATVSFSTKKSTAIQAAHGFLANAYEVQTSDVTLGDAVCITSNRYSCETWTAGYIIVKYNKTLTGFVRFDPYGAQDLRHQLME